MKELRWFAADIDRDHTDGSYGDGIRLYIDSSENPTDNVGNLKYCVVTGVTYDESLNILTIKDESGEDFKLDRSGRFSHSHNYIKKLCNIYDYNLDNFRKNKLRVFPKLN